MTSPSRPTSRAEAQPDPSRDRLREDAIAALLPFFIDSAAGDERTTRIVIAGLLDDYRAATPKELQLSAQIIALSWASLACLSASMAFRDQSMDEMLRLQGYALALDRLSQKSGKALDTRRKERARDPDRMSPEDTQWDACGFEAAIGQARKRMLEAKARLAAFMATLSPATAPDLSGLIGEPMTPTVLARRRRG